MARPKSLKPKARIIRFRVDRDEERRLLALQRAAGLDTPSATLRALIHSAQVEQLVVLYSPAPQASAVIPTSAVA